MSIPDQLFTKIQDRMAAAERLRINPLFNADLIWRPCTVSILLVADDFLFFSDDNFGLSDLISILKDENLVFVRFNITVAHRGSVTDLQIGVGNPRITAGIRNFRFDDPQMFDPARFHQVWLFGSMRSDLTPQGWSGRLADSELRVLTQFMDDGGGVFATGDHEDLGCAMGGFLPRVRQMRRWFYPAPGPNGEGLAPSFDGPGRFDTNRIGHDPIFQFDDQSDDIPQPITPKLYTARLNIFREAVFPHPVLCGPRGPIDILPDHPHESQCTEARDPDLTVSLDGVDFTEFGPATDGGERPLPEVIAMSTVIGGHTTTTKSGTTIARSFGAIAAYDGHRADVGRIVTDATWHHFINVNLTGVIPGPGVPTPSDSRKLLGFLATPSGREHYQKISSYFLNIAQWLCPKAKVECMRNWTFLSVIWSERLVEVFDPAITLDTARVIDFVLIGRHARDAIGKYASQCQSYRWAWGLVLERIPFPPFIDKGDPWRPMVDDQRDSPIVKDLEPSDLLDIEWVSDAALGGAILALREKMFPLNQERLDAFDEIAQGLTRDGANAALAKSLSFLGSGIRDISAVIERDLTSEGNIR